MAKFIDETGNKYGRLVAIERAENKGSVACWLCQCECGNETVVRGGSLRGGSTRSCGCLHNPRSTLPMGVAAFNGLFCNYRTNAKKKGRNWELTKEQFRSLTQLPCHYCGAIPSQVHGGKRFNGGKKFNGSYIYNGLDRMDNDEGYILDNVVPCCWECNQMKRAKGYNEFINWIERVRVHARSLEQLQKRLEIY